MNENINIGEIEGFNSLSCTSEEQQDSFIDYGDPYVISKLPDIQLPYLNGPTATHPIRTEPKISRNSLCPCDSGKKYKKCCINN